MFLQVSVNNHGNLRSGDPSLRDSTSRHATLSSGLSFLVRESGSPELPGGPVASWRGWVPRYRRSAATARHSQRRAIAPRDRRPSKDRCRRVSDTTCWQWQVSPIDLHYGFSPVKLDLQLTLLKTGFVLWMICLYISFYFNNLNRLIGFYKVLCLLIKKKFLWHIVNRIRVDDFFMCRLN